MRSGSMRGLALALLVSGCADPCAHSDTCIDLEVSGDVGPLDTLGLAFDGVVTRQTDAPLPPPAAPPPVAVGVVLLPVSGVLDVTVLGLLDGRVAGWGATQAAVTAHTHQRVSVVLAAGSPLGDGGLPCPLGQILCAGSCVSAGSIDHCGDCNNVCSFPNATAWCANGACGYTCLPDWGDCDGDPATGCETSLAADPQHCGSCTGTCQVANGSAVCANGSCTLVRCNDCYTGCAGADTCDTNLCTDPMNCGGCGNSCATSTLGTACLSRQCGCLTAGDCLPKAADHCDGNLCACSTSAVPCPSSKTCTSGKCLLDQGQLCTTNSQCASGMCSGNVCS
jgi:hypothetical protein